MSKKRVLIVSDTHRNAIRIKDVMKQSGPFDMALILGDIESHQAYIEEVLKCPIQVVRGNCDWDSDWPIETLVEIAGHMIFMTHGHRYDVNYGTGELEITARSFGADVALFGHTHVPAYQVKEDGFVILNPGSLGSPRQHPAEPSYVVMDADEKSGKLTFHQCCLKQKSFWHRL